MFGRTERLLLRPGWPDDAAALAAAIGDEAVVRNLATAPWPYGEQDALRFLTTAHDWRLPNLLLFQRTGGAPRLIGGCGIHRSGAGDAHELGYWIARPFWGLGFATEAARHVVGIARAMRLPPLVAGHFIDNPASGRVLRKIGFRPTGAIAPRHSVARGRAVPTHLFVEDPAASARGEARDADADMPAVREEWRLLAA